MRDIAGAVAGDAPRLFRRGKPPPAALRHAEGTACF